MLLEQLIKCNPLTVDDLAFRKIDQTTGEYLYTIVEDRYRDQSIILTSNHALGDWLGILPDPVSGGAILDWLAHQAHQIQRRSESVRKKIGLKSQNPTQHLCRGPKPVRL